MQEAQLWCVCQINVGKCISQRSFVAFCQHFSATRLSELLSQSLFLKSHYYQGKILIATSRSLLYSTVLSLILRGIRSRSTRPIALYLTAHVLTALQSMLSYPQALNSQHHHNQANNHVQSIPVLANLTSYTPRQSDRKTPLSPVHLRSRSLFLLVLTSLTALSGV